MSKKAKELMMISADKAIEYYLATLVTEGKSLSYVEWLKSRLKLFNGFLKETGRENQKLQNLTVDDGRAYLRFLMQRTKRFSNHPHHKEQEGKLTVFTSTGWAGL